MKKIKVIIFDLGGVVFKGCTPRAIKRLKSKYGFSDDLLEKIFYGKKARDLRLGKIEPFQVWEHVDSILPKELKLKAAEIRKIWYDSYIPPKGIFSLIKKLKQNYKLGIVSGNVRERVDFLDKKYDFRKYFDFEVYSFDFNVNKPAPILYEKALEEARVDAPNCLYIDDWPEYLEPAEKLGMQVILFKNFNQLLKKLRKRKIKF